MEDLGFRAEVEMGWYKMVGKCVQEGMSSEFLGR